MSFDIKIEGRGIWHTIHTLALYATNESLKNAFVLTMDSLAKNFACEICKPDFNKFINQHPFKNYWNLKQKNEEIGLFKWTWELHNTINQKLGKPILSFDDAYNMTKYHVCKNCNKNPILIPLEEKLNLISYY